jgi:hypothetical protein
MTPPLDHLKRIAQISAELMAHRPISAPGIAVKAFLARSFWGIEATRFLMLGLHEQRITRWADCMSYLLDLEPGLRTINWQGEGRRLTVDKLMTAERLAARGLPFVAPLAVIGRNSAEHPHQGRFPTVNSVEQLARLLATAPAELFAKPADGWRGSGVMGPERQGELWRLDADALSDTQLAERLIAAARPSGLLLQRRLRCHRELAPVGGELGLGTLRINTALLRDGVEIFFVFAKIMGSKGLVDNFSGGKFGNLLAAVDKTSGTIIKAFGRKRTDRYLMREVTHHPVTGARLAGFRFPLWDATAELAKRVAAAFPESPLIGLDIAITDDGPLVVEAQSDWDANAAQLMIGGGLRPLLRDLVPRLALDDRIRQQAVTQMGLTHTRHRHRRSRHPSRHERLYVAGTKPR